MNEGADWPPFCGHYVETHMGTLREALGTLRGHFGDTLSA